MRVDIYEPLWRIGQTLKEPAFLPLPLPDNRHASWRELRIQVDFFRRGGHQVAEKTGIFSPKFRLKSNLSGDQFLAFARSHPDADVCFVNVFPTMPYYSYNVWMQGEAAHPGLVQRAQRLLAAAGLDWDLSKTPRHHRGHLCYGNFWVGTPAFWQAYVGEVLDPVARFLETCPQAPEARAVFESAPYLVEAPFLPFIAERLFSTFVSRRPDIRTAPFHPVGHDPLANCSSAFRREVVQHLRARVDEADAANHFPESLIREQALFAKLSTMYHHLHFQLHSHPHLVPEEMPPSGSEVPAAPPVEGATG